MEDFSHPSIGELIKLKPEDVFSYLKSSPDGLTESDASLRLEKFGPNEIAEIAKEPVYLKFLKQFTHFFAILLWIAALLSFVAGMPELGVAVVAVIVINGIFSFWQEYKAEKAAEELKKLLPYTVQVLRDGKVVEIPASQVTVGDVVILQEGNKVPADMRLVKAVELQVDASVLTGESKPVRKYAEPLVDFSENFINATNLCFAGMNVVSGTGQGVVYATGMDTEFGKIARLTQALEEEPSPLQKEMGFVTRVIAGIAISMGIVFYILGVALAGLTKVEGFLFAIGIIVANVPEGLLPTLTLSLAMAAQKLARENALIKRLSTVETLGSSTVICTDKTGTLTKNEMTVKKVWSGNYFEVSGIGYKPEGKVIEAKSGREVKEDELTENLKLLLLGADLCNNSRLVSENGLYRIIGDPTEGALKTLACKYETAKELSKEFKRIREIPFNSFRKRMSVICSDKNKELWCFAKGAPEVLLDLCDYFQFGSEIKPLSPDKKAEILKVVEDFSRQAYRVIAIAYKKLESGVNVFVLNEEEVESGLIFLGLAAMIDPPRPEVEEAVKKCQTAGIKIIMITGDHGLTAAAVAKKIGIADDFTPIVTGSEIDNMGEEELKKILKGKNCIFARVSPEHKLKIVSLLKEMGEIVAVTGDGVNDAPALKKADIGVAMGLTGTDVAKEAADLILLDDNFATIVKAVEEGRAVFDNIRRFITYIFASNIPEIVPYLVFVLSGGKIPLPLTVLQILAVDVGTDLVPALALGAETPEKDVMTRPPRPRNERLLNLSLFLRAYGYLGIFEAIACMASFFFAYIRAGYSIALPLIGQGFVYLKARTMCLASIITSQIGNGFACRTTRESIFSKGFTTNKLYLVGIVAELTLISIFIYVPFFARVFGHKPLDYLDWAFLMIWPPLILFADELRKYIIRIKGRLT